MARGHSKSCSLKSFLGVAGEGIDERESGKFEEGLNSKVKLSLYRTFGKIVEFKKYLRGVGDAGTRLLFSVRSHLTSKRFGVLYFP